MNPQPNEQSQDHTITYFVNNEVETSDERERDVRSILEGAGFSPASDYTLKSQNPPEDYGTDYDRRIRIHPNQRFTARYTAPTPTS